MAMYSSGPIYYLQAIHDTWTGNQSVGSYLSAVSQKYGAEI